MQWIGKNTIFPVLAASVCYGPVLCQPRDGIRRSVREKHKFPVHYPVPQSKWHRSQSPLFQPRQPGSSDQIRSQTLTKSPIIKKQFCQSDSEDFNGGILKSGPGFYKETCFVFCFLMGTWLFESGNKESIIAVLFSKNRSP